VDLRFAFEQPPADVTVMGASATNAESSIRSAANPRGPDRPAWWSPVHAFYTAGKFASAIVVGSYLSMSLWLYARNVRRLFVADREPVALHETIVMALGGVVWTFLLAYAAR